MKTFQFLIIYALLASAACFASLSAQPLWIIPPGGRTFTAENASIHAATCIIRPEGAYAECEWHISLAKPGFRLSGGQSGNSQKIDSISQIRDSVQIAELFLPIAVPRGSVVMGAVVDAPLSIGANSVSTGNVSVGAANRASYFNLQTMTTAEARTAFNNSIVSGMESVLLHLDTMTASEERYIVRLFGRFDGVRTVRVRFYAPVSWAADEATVRFPCSHLQSSQTFPFTLVYGINTGIWSNVYIAEARNLGIIQPSSLAPMLTRDSDEGIVYWGTTATVVGVEPGATVANRARVQTGVFANIVAENAITFRCVPVLQPTQSLALPAFSSSQSQTTARMNTSGFVVRSYEKEGKGVFQTLFFPERAWNLVSKQPSRAKLLLIYDVEPARALTTAASPVEKVYSALQSAMSAADSIAVIVSTKNGIVSLFPTWKSANISTLRAIRDTLSDMQSTMTSLLGTSLVEAVRFVERNNPENAGILLISNAHTLFGTNTTANVDILSPATVLQQIRAAASRLPSIHIADIQTSVAGTQHLDGFYWTLFTNSGGSYGRLWSSNWRSMELLLGIQIPQILKIQETAVETVESASLRTTLRNALTFDRITNPPLRQTTQLPKQAVVLQCGRYERQDQSSQIPILAVEGEGRLSSRLYLSRTNELSIMPAILGTIPTVASPPLPTPTKGNRTDEDIWAIEQAISLQQHTPQITAQEFLRHCLHYGIVSRQTMLVFAPSTP